MVQSCYDYEMIRVQMNSFHVSGRPGKHQWMQSAYVAGSACWSVVSILPWRMVQTEVWASFRYSERAVIFMKWTGTLIICVTFRAAQNRRRSVPTSNGVVVSSTGIVSFAHFIPSGLFQSKLLFYQSETIMLKHSHYI